MPLLCEEQIEDTSRFGARIALPAAYSAGRSSSLRFALVRLTLRSGSVPVVPPREILAWVRGNGRGAGRTRADSHRSSAPNPLLSPVAARAGSGGERPPRLPSSRTPARERSPPMAGGRGVDRRVSPGAGVGIVLTLLAGRLAWKRWAE